MKEKLLKVHNWCLSHYVYYFLGMCGLFLVDIVSKKVIEAILLEQPNHYITVIPGVGDRGFFALSLLYNTGAFGGMLGGTLAGRIVLVSISLIATVAMCWAFVKYFKNMNKAMLVGVILCIPGTFGNFIDRFLMVCGLQEGVIDFLWFDLGFNLGPINFHPWNIFNIADAYLVVGIIVFLVGMIVSDVKAGKKEKVEEDKIAQNKLEQDYLNALKKAQEEQKEKKDE